MAEDPIDPLDKLALDIRARKPPKKTHKATRTMALAEPNFSIFQRYCQAKGIPHSEVIDSLVSVFLQKVADDLPREPPPPKGRGKV